MPEGDTIHRVAARLRPALEGQRLERFEAARLVGPAPTPGTHIRSVEARGKHLLVGFDGGLVLRVHLGMRGSWHLYREGQRWRRPPWTARCVLVVEGWEAVAFGAPTVRTELAGDDTPRGISGLGPDLCEGAPDLDLAVARMAHHPDGSLTVAEVLLDQRVAAGIGNVFKSEVLFACGVDPFTPLAEVDGPTRRRLLEAAHRQLRANLGRARRTTVAGGLAVYGRAGRPCRRCGTPVEVRRHGEAARATYWCPRCQARAERGGR